MDVEVILKPIVWEKVSQGMLILLHQPKGTPVLAMAVAGQNRQGHVNFLPIVPADEEWTVIDGFSQSTYVLAQIENAIIRPATIIPDGSAVGGLASIPPGALVGNGSEFMIAGRPTMTPDGSRPGYDLRTGATTTLSGTFWFNKWSIFAPDPSGSEPTKICDCFAKEKKSA